MKPIAKGPVKNNLIPGSDGAGVVVDVGSAVTSFKAGDKVVTHIALNNADDDMPSVEDLATGLGERTDGTLRRLGVFRQSALVHMPTNLSFAQAATLTCTGLTAWNALMCSLGRAVGPGDYVLVQGTGAVSVAALEIAVAAGATVIATTSTDAKATRLRTLGAKHVINYRSTTNWGQVARSFTPKGRGVDFVVDTGGYATLDESMSATKVNGVVCVTGASGGFGVEKPDVFQVLFRAVVLRGICVGTRGMLQDMVRFVERHDLKPAIDDVTFGLKEVKEAFKRLEDKKHFAKIIIMMD
ncbi:hypothetical protein CCMA1212_007847 [Trichoderma ghanense]|uniref:Enoyl reductase (ER) domain-containing protein n=1 Tax=Trichoderma ghanense TaxID=65468 RepID=A0ABY2H086_9HYPO